MEINFPKIEEKILEFWKKDRVFEKSILRRKNAKDFVFYEGPPTANGKPGIHHVESRVYKDIICRYKTMQGFRVLRKAGWDTHGLPVELEVEKKLGLKNKKDIEKYGIAEFNKKCKESVWQYKDEWEKLTERISFWLDLEHPYITYENNYIESVWWAIKQIYQKGLLYKDYKVVPYCPRCGTSLSSHEVAQGYKRIKEPSVYVKFEIAPKTHLLVWTTTPWTLPGNVAVAVNPKITYIKAKIGDDVFILAKERTAVLGEDYEIVEEFKGDKLVGIKYKPLFGFVKPDKLAWFVIPADFVSTEDGTGLVHIAPAFGEDDMVVGKKNNLSVILNVDEEGRFKKEVTNWAGMFVKDADPLIVKNLQERGLLFREELYEHDYPFCWRCNSPLLYYAKESWFINMQKVKSALIKNNEGINWVPSHLKEGRFGEWLREVKDWAFSRERYWGTPLPIWQCQSCSHREVIGSQKDLLAQNFSDNNYYLLRHGESLRQKNKRVSCWPEKVPCPLTEKGRKQIEKTAKELKSKRIDLIFSSDLLRAKQTAEIVSKEVGVDVIYDERLREFNAGIFNNRETKEVWDYIKKQQRGLFSASVPEGESWNEIKKRVRQFMAEINDKYSGKDILIVSHELPISLIESISSSRTNEDILKWRIKNSVGVGEFRKIAFKNLSYNEQMELDFHRPYIDEVKFQCPKCQGVMTRVPEVIDCWFDSGSMPFAQCHYPFEKKDFQFPADYISEAVDQTRGWFYTLLALSTLLGFSSPYKNVISLGHVLDEKGEKMSKSKGNVVNPWDIIEKYGVDAARWYFYTVNQPGDPKLFAEKDVDQAFKKFILTYWNSFVFFETYKQKTKNKKQKTKNVLDKWVLSKLNGLIQEVTQKLDKYDVTGAARAVEDFTVNDLSLWYIRRSRKRFKEAQGVLGYTLLTLSKLTAPFIPFLSEEIYRQMKEVQPLSSVHLADWPKADSKLIDKKLDQEMEKTRGIVASVLAERAKAGIKVRQPLASLQITEKISQNLIDLVKEEVNVKEIVFGKELRLDTKITPELKEEGTVREIIRQIQEMRKKAGLKPQDKILVQYFGSPELNKILEKNKKIILTQIQAKELTFTKELVGQEIILDQQKLCLYLATKNQSRLNK